MISQSEQELIEVARNMTDIPSRRIAPWTVIHRDRPRRSQGRLTILHHDDRGDVMSNDLFEVEEAAEFASKCSGQVLVLGLGLGMIVRMLLARPEVDQIHVIESEREVIELVGPSVQDDRVKLYNANAYDGDAPEHLFGDRKFDAVWMDVWDNAESSTYMLRRFANKIWGDRSDLVGIWAYDRSEDNYNAQN